MSRQPLVVTDTRRAVEVTGVDRVSFLDATLTQDVGRLPVGAVAGALWLDVHGATLAAMDLVVLEERIVAVVASAHVAPVLEKLAMRTFLADAAFRLLDDVVVAVRGAADDRVASGHAQPVGDVVVIGRADGLDVVGPAAAVAAWLEESGLPGPTDDLQGLLDDEVLRGVPRAPSEIDGPHLPEELGLLPTHVHLAKGCYPGQEAVARMWMLGRPRRRLVVVSVDDGRPEPGAEAGAGRERWQVQRVTSNSADDVHATVLAPSSVAVDDRVEGQGWSGHVVRIVGEGLDQPGADPRVTRRRDRPAGQRGNRLPG